MKRFYSFFYYRVLGWNLIGDFSKNTVPKCIIVAVPHTSWHDFYIGLLIRKITDTTINFLGKKELFKGVSGWYFRKVGGIPLDRTSGQNTVVSIAKLFEDYEELRITIAPEGTRKKVKRWKTGFYFVAKKAKVPIILITFDFKKKQNVISAPFYPTDNTERDFEYMYAFFKGVKGKVPEYSFTRD